MSIETLLYIYLFICASMVVFNIVTAFLLKQRDKKIMHVSDNFRHEIMVQIERVNQGKGVEDKHKSYLMKKLCRIGNMLAFDNILEELYELNKEQVIKYLCELDNVIVYVSTKYSQKERIEAAYFPYIIKKYKLIENRNLNSVVEAMFHLLKEPSIYSRENAMQAIYTTGNSDCVIRALKIIDNGEFFFHEKLLADGLLNFTGNHMELCEKIINCFFEFSDAMKIALLNFMRFDNGNYRQFAYEILSNEKINDEVRYSAIRYLGKYFYEKAYEYLLYLADEKNNNKWEYPVLASMALAIYPGDETVQLLKHNLYSKNWYIRFNSSLSLERLGLTYLDFIDVIEGNDRFASEILRYRFDIKEISRKE